MTFLPLTAIDFVQLKKGRNIQQKVFQAFSFLKQAQRIIQNYCIILTGYGNKTFNSPQLSNNMFKTHASNKC